MIGICHLQFSHCTVGTASCSAPGVTSYFDGIPSLHEPTRPLASVGNRHASPLIDIRRRTTHQGLSSRVRDLATNVPYGNVNVTICYEQVRKSIDKQGPNPFARWDDWLNAPAAAKVGTALTQMKQSNFTNIKSVGAGALEFRIDFGFGHLFRWQGRWRPGYPAVGGGQEEPTTGQPDH